MILGFLRKIFKTDTRSIKKTRKKSKKKAVKKSIKKVKSKKTSRKKVSKKAIKKRPLKKKKTTKKLSGKKKILKKTKKKSKLLTSSRPPKKTLKKKKKISEKEIGKIIHYFGKISVGIIKLKKSLKVNEAIHIKGANTDFIQIVTSIQVNHREVSRASAGAEVGVKVIQKVNDKDKVYVAT